MQTHTPIVKTTFPDDHNLGQTCNLVENTNKHPVWTVLYFFVLSEIFRMFNSFNKRANFLL